VPRFPKKLDALASNSMPFHFSKHSGIYLLLLRLGVRPGTWKLAPEAPEIIEKHTSGIDVHILSMGIGWLTSIQSSGT
jgi:hypothetical protein